MIETSVSYTKYIMFPLDQAYFADLLLIKKFLPSYDIISVILLMQNLGFFVGLALQGSKVAQAVA